MFCVETTCLASRCREIAVFIYGFAEKCLHSVTSNQ